MGFRKFKTRKTFFLGPRRKIGFFGDLGIRGPTLEGGDLEKLGSFKIFFKISTIRAPRGPGFSEREYPRSQILVFHEFGFVWDGKRGVGGDKQAIPGSGA